MPKGLLVISWLRAIVREGCRFNVARSALLFQIPIIALLLLGLAGTARAQSITDVAEWGKRIQSGHSIGSLGTDLFGDSTSYYDGSTSFTVTDIDLPGNNALPVRLGRTLAAEDAEGLEVGGLMANWNLDIPYISGVYTTTYGWKNNGNTPYARCSNPTGAMLINDIYGPPWDYWRGNSLYIPGHGKHSLLQGYQGPAMADGQTTQIGTLDFSQVRCLSSLANPSSAPGYTGEAFLVTDSSGNQYTFNWMVTRPFSTVVRPWGSQQRQLAREEVRLYPTQVKDRFGNTVTYSWTGSRLNSISSSDGRTITLSYNSDGTIASAVANGRTWQYGYAADTLTGVQLPDGSSWSIGTAQLTIIYDSTKPQPSACDELGPWLPNLARTYTFKHPSGATGSFTFSPMRHGRTQVGRPCQNSAQGDPVYVKYGAPIVRDNFALTQKQISGPALQTMTWTAAFSAAVGGYYNCGSSCPPDTKTVTVTNPDGSYNVYTYGIRYYTDEGKLLRRQTYTAANALIRDESTSYALNPSSPPYAVVVGSDGTIHSDNFSDSELTPRTQTTLLQDGDTYTNTVNSFDNFARTVSVTRSNSFGGSRTDVKAYYDDLQHWVVGQIKSSTTNGVVESATDYSPTTALPTTTYHFGLAQLSFTYNGDGTMATIKDGLGRTATLSNWKRGAPQNALFPDNSTKSAGIDDNGWITGTTDARGNPTTYGYDAMGRNTLITYPPGDPGGWAPVVTSYAVLAASELGIPVGSWRSRTTVARLQTSTYYDGLWRPILVEEKDTTTGTLRYTSTSYDYESHPLFKSYPSTASNPTSGIRSTYDALGRLTQKNNTDGTTLQTISYLSGSRQQVKDASQNLTTTTYQAFDAPSGSTPILISAPGQTTTINRSVFGEITLVQQSGAEGTLTDTYVYDGYRRLCKRIEPETGQTVINYDAASQITWSATGQNGSTSSCDYGTVPAAAQIVNSYDLMGRKNSVTYPDGSGNLTLGYDPDGHLTSASNPTATWTYGWNNRGLLKWEQAVIDGNTFKLTPGYNTQANLDNRTYPDNTNIAYNPDAWGRPTTVGSYATGVQYYPNNLPSSYTLGNGLSYGQSLDSWLRPQTVAIKNGGTLLQSLTYGYNGDSDLMSIADGVDGVDSASFQYDGLHRLTQAVDNNLWGTYTYSYDAFNNTKSHKVSATRTDNYVYDSTTNRLQTVSYSVPTGTCNDCCNPSVQACPPPSSSSAFSAAASSGPVSLPVIVRSYTYDGRGRITADGVHGYTWNLADEITAIPGVANYAYDAHGNRIKTTLPNSTVEYALYDLSGALVYTSKAGVATDYLDLNGQAVAEVANGTPTYLHADLLGSPRLATTSSKALAWREHYDPYGVKLNGVANKIGYTGHAYDAESGLTYMKARIYDAQVGRFLSGDPIAFTGDPRSFNRYSYGNNNPYRYFDPTGMDEASRLEAIEGECTGSHIGCSRVGSQPSSSDNERIRYDDAKTEAGQNKGGQGQKSGGGDFGSGNSSLPKYDSSNPNYHEYSVLTMVCDSAQQLGCSAGYVFDQGLDRYSAPGLDGSPIKNGETRSLPGFGPTSFLVNSQTMTIVNVTNAGHILYPGYVERSVVTVGSQVFIQTHGVGIGNFGNMNSAGANVLWHTVDRQIANSLTGIYPQTQIVP